MPHPLSIVELLDRILSFLDDSSIAEAAVVCKFWRDCAMPILWDDVDARIFKVLGVTQCLNRDVVLMVRPLHFSSKSPLLKKAFAISTLPR